MSGFLSLSTLANGSYLGALTLKSLTSAAIFSVMTKYLNQLDLKDKALLRGFIGSFMSSAVAELLMTSIVQRLLSLSGSNAGIKRIFDQGLNALYKKYLDKYDNVQEQFFEFEIPVEGTKFNIGTHIGTIFIPLLH